MRCHDLVVLSLHLVPGGCIRHCATRQTPIEPCASQGLLNGRHVVDRLPSLVNGGGVRRVKATHRSCIVLTPHEDRGAERRRRPCVGRRAPLVSAVDDGE